MSLDTLPTGSVSLHLLLERTLEVGFHILLDHIQPLIEISAQSLGRFRVGLTHIRDTPQNGLFLSEIILVGRIQLTNCSSNVGLFFLRNAWAGLSVDGQTSDLLSF